MGGVVCGSSQVIDLPIMGKGFCRRNTHQKAGGNKSLHEIEGGGGLYPKKCAKKLLIDQASVIAKSSKQNYVGKLTTKDDGTRNKIDMF